MAFKTPTTKLPADDNKSVSKKNRKQPTKEEDAAGDGFDPRFASFVGSVDVAAHEEDLRALFEGVVIAEQGPPPEGIKSWVQGVRIILDKDTQLGKGFAYVKFAVGLT